MDNQEAIEILKIERDHMTPTLFAERIKAIDMAISALQAQDGTDTNVGNMVSRQKAIDAVCSVCGVDCDKSEFVYDGKQEDQVILCPEHYALTQLPSAQSEWNNHTVACLLAELFDDTCACNYNGIDEWLPSRCEVVDSCPNPVGVACWEQYLKHRVERRTDG